VKPASYEDLKLQITHLERVRIHGRTLGVTNIIISYLYTVFVEVPGFYIPANVSLTQRTWR